MEKCVNDVSIQSNMLVVKPASGRMKFRTRDFSMVYDSGFACLKGPQLIIKSEMENIIKSP